MLFRRDSTLNGEGNALGVLKQATDGTVRNILLEWQTVANSGGPSLCPMIIFSAKDTPLFLFVVKCSLGALRETHLLHAASFSNLWEMAWVLHPVVDAPNFRTITDRTL
jgi:hypothetical protein